MTKSVSPGSNLMRPSNRPHSVSSRLTGDPLGATFSVLDRRPIHLRPEIIRTASASDGHPTTCRMWSARALTRDDDEADIQGEQKTYSRLIGTRGTASDLCGFRK